MSNRSFSLYTLLLLLLASGVSVSALIRPNSRSAPAKSYHDYSQWKTTRAEGQRLLETLQEQRKKKISGDQTQRTLNPSDALRVLELRGGGVVGVVRTLAVTAIRNTKLLFLVLGSVATRIYRDAIPYSVQLEGFLQFLLLGYFFFLVCEWQQMSRDAESS